MPNWFTPADTDLNDHKVAELVNALREEALGVGQTDPMPGIITEVVNELRAAIGFSGRYQLDAVETAIPNSLREMASKKIVRVLKGRLSQLLDKSEEADDEKYESRLKALTAGKWPVETPDNVIATPAVLPTGGAELVSGTCRQATGAKLRGL